MGVKRKYNYIITIITQGYIIKHNNYTFWLIISCFIILTTSIISLSLYEYYMLKNNNEQLKTLQELYRANNQILQEIILSTEQNQKKLLSQDVITKHDNRSFSKELQHITLNRSPLYLQQSTSDFFKKQKLDEFLPLIDENHWKTYTDQLLTNQQSSIKNQNQKTYQTQYKNKPLHNHITIPFHWPIAKSQFWLSSFFGPRRKKNGTIGFHNGIDIAAIKGTIVMAAAAGIVVEAGYSGGYGNTIVIEHDKKFKTRYAHLDTISVSRGQKIKSGCIIGKVGETGYIRKISRDGSHLHFEVFYRGKRVNPLSYLPLL